MAKEYKIGDVVTIKGVKYRFKGGNSKKKANWQTSGQLRGEVKPGQRSRKLKEARRESFKEQPWHDRFLAGAGETFVNTARGIKDMALGSSRSPFDLPDYEQFEADALKRVQQQEMRQQQGEPFRQASEGDFAAGAGGFTADMALTALPAGVGGKIGTGAKLGQRVLSGLGMGGASAGVHQVQNVGSGEGYNALEAVGEMGLGGALPFAKPLAKKMTKGVQKWAESTAEEIGQVPLEGLRMWQTKQGQQALKNAWGKELATSKKMVDNVFNASKTLPEAPYVNNVMKTMGKIDPTPVVQEIDNAIAKVSLKSTNKAMVTKLKRLKEDFVMAEAKQPGPVVLGEGTNIPVIIKPSGRYVGKWEAITRPQGKLQPGATKIPKTFDTKDAAIKEYTRRGYKAPTPVYKKFTAQELRDKRIELDDIIDWNKPGASKMNTLLKGPRAKAAQLLVDNAPREYQPAMASYAEKLNTIGKMKRVLGNDKEAAKQKAFTMLRTVDNQTRQPVKEVLANFDKTFGTSYTKQAELMHMARMMGKAGKEKLELPLYSKAATGNRVQAWLRLGLAHPRLAPKALAAFDKPAALYDYTRQQALKIPEYARRRGEQALGQAGRSYLGGQ